MALAVFLFVLAAVLVSTVRRAVASHGAAVGQAVAIIVTAAANLVLLVTTHDTGTRIVSVAVSAALIGALYRWSFLLRRRDTRAWRRP